MGGIPPGYNNVILLCAISFLLNHDPDLRIFSRDCRRFVPLQEGQRAIQPQARRLCDQAHHSPSFCQLQMPLRCHQPGPSRGSSLPTSLSFFQLLRTSGPTISGVCDDQYTATLESLEETGNEAIKLYLTRKTHGWFRRWGGPRTSAAAASQPPAPPPEPPPPPVGLRHRRKTRCLCRQTTRVVLRSSCRSWATVIRCRHQPCPWRRCHRRAGRTRLCQAPLACAIGYTHIEIICLQNCINVGIDCGIIDEIIGEIMDVIIYDIIDL